MLWTRIHAAGFLLMISFCTKPSTVSQLQQDLAALERWSLDWGMKFNEAKCHVMFVSKKTNHRPYLYQLCGEIPSSVLQEKYLGVLLSHDMSWSTHINKVVAEAHQKLGFIRRNLRGSPQECKKLTFLALVCSGLEYASIIWDPYFQKDYDSIERVQRKAARWVTSSYDRCTSVTKLLKDLQWDSLQERRRQQRLLFMYKILNDQVVLPANSIDLTYSSRPVRGDKNKKTLFKPRTNTKELQKSFVHITIPDWNSLPHSVAQSGTEDYIKCLLAVLPWGTEPSLR